jgi:glycosyltransferase involved in cell wall biosynthesis
MKVLHISTNDYGGAGMAAIRLHSSLLKLGVDSKLLCLNKATRNIEEVYTFPTGDKKYPTIFQRLLRKANIGLSYNDRLALAISKACENIEYFSSPVSCYEVHLNKLVQDADIIHLHWIVNFIDYQSFFKNVDKPIVWTLHDFNPDQGGLHLKYDKQNLRHKLLISYETQLTTLKKESLKNINVTLVSPSKWFQKNLDHNVLSDTSNNFVIHHGIDEQVFKIHDKKFSRDVLGIAEDETVFICVASNLNRAAKGFDLLLESLDKLAKKFNFTLLAVGEASTLKRPYLKSIGKIENESFLALTYSAADAFLSSSLEESFSMSAAEALMCGLPVISTPVGFMEELIKNDFNGYITKSFKTKDFYNAVETFIMNCKEFSPSSIRSFAVEKFSVVSQTNEYINIYSEIIKN